MRATAALLLILHIAVTSAGQAGQSPRPQPIQGGFGKGAYAGPDVVAGVIKVVVPTYSPEALQAAIEGSVELEVVVDGNGSVRDVRVTKSLDAVHGLDNRAIEAARKWKFRPASIDGKEVACVVPIAVSFHLHEPGLTTGSPHVEAGVRASDSQPPGTNAASSNLIACDAPGVVHPMMTATVEPAYTSDAMQRKIQGDVEVEGTIGVDGRPRDLKVVKSLDKGGLDGQALLALARWRFTPARSNGRAVQCRATFVLTFKLH